MLNQIVLVGRLTKTEKLESENGISKIVITLAVPRSFKNANGEYDTDSISCVLFGGVAENTIEYCQKGDLVGVKGRIQGDNEKIEIVGERITFLSSKKSTREEDDGE